MDLNSDPHNIHKVTSLLAILIEIILSCPLRLGRLAILKMLKVDTNDSIFQFGTKTHRLFLWGFSLHLKMRERAVSFMQKLEKGFQTASYRKKSGSKLGVR